LIVNHSYIPLILTPFIRSFPSSAWECSLGSSASRNRQAELAEPVSQAELGKQQTTANSKSPGLENSETIPIHRSFSHRSFPSSAWECRAGSSASRDGKQSLLNRFPSGAWETAKTYPTEQLPKPLHAVYLDTEIT